MKRAAFAGTLSVFVTSREVTTTGRTQQNISGLETRVGRVFPLFQEWDSRESNLRPALLRFLTDHYGEQIGDEDLMAYLAGVAANPAYTARFQPDLVQPGLRIPLTADVKLFNEAAEIGRRVIWLHTYGERFMSSTAGRRKGSPRLPKAQAPRIPAKGAIPNTPAGMPESIDYDRAKQRLLIGEGYVERVTPEMWNYEVSGKQILRQWFSYRKKDRSKPIIANRRPPSKLNEIQPDHWLAEYTSDLIDLLNVLGLLIELEPKQADLLERICGGELLSRETLENDHALELPPKRTRKKAATGQKSLLDGLD